MSVIAGEPALEGTRARPRGPRPAAAVRRELARALGAGLLLPIRTFGYLLARSALQAEVQSLLDAPARVVDPPPIARLPARPLSIFVSCAEASGEIHARSLVRALRQKIDGLGGPPARFFGLGGARLEAEGVVLVGRPVERSSMGFEGLAASLPYYLALLRDAATRFESERPDVFVPVDSPALHVPLAHIARRYGIPTVHFVTPQYWGWAPWRANGYRAAIDRALTILPFEPAWFERRGIPVAHVGHPLLDALATTPETRPSGSAQDLVLLPGSRERVIERNLPWMLAAAARVHAHLSGIAVVVAHEDRTLRPGLEAAIERAGARAWARVEVGDLHATLARARSALSVSGTVLLDLLHHRLPAVVVYRLSSRLEAWMARHLLTVPYFASVNLLAGRAVYPEFCFAGDGPLEEIVASLVRAHTDPAWRTQCDAGLDLARERLGPTGAAERAAAEVLAIVAGRVGEAAATRRGG